MHVAPGHLRLEVNDRLHCHVIRLPTGCFWHRWREGWGCLSITTWWWVWSTGGGGSWTDLAAQNMWWGSVENVWQSPMSVHSSPTGERLSHPKLNHFLHLCCWSSCLKQWSQGHLWASGTLKAADGNNQAKHAAAWTIEGKNPGLGAICGCVQLNSSPSDTSMVKQTFCCLMETQTL